jgi:hypothetical protein
MQNQNKELYGSWLQAIGTVISAIGGTPSKRISSDIQNSLDLWGNVLQATGNALIADAQQEASLEKIGNEIQSIGNSLVIAGIVIDFKEETQKRLIITGNWFQALGGATALGDELQEEISKLYQIYNIIGNLLQSIGNSLQAIGGTYELKENNPILVHDESSENGQTLQISGGWIQAIGSVLSLLGQIKEVKDNTQLV